MRGWILREYDNPDALRFEDLPENPLAPDEVRVQVKAAGVTYVDMLMAEGGYQFKPDLPYIPGAEVAGDVVEVGKAVKNFKVGDRVFGGSRTGGFCERSVMPESIVNKLPAPFTYGQGAAFMSAYMTAHVGVALRGQLEAGETLLVHGAAGGVGLAAVDIGRVMGARVIATASTEEKRQALRDYGVAHVLDSAPGFKDKVKELTDGRGADVIYDPVGGPVFDESLRCIAPFGRLCVIGFTSRIRPTAPANIILIKQISVVGVRAGEYWRLKKDAENTSKKVLLDWAEAGKLHPHVYRELPLDQLKQAFQLIDSRKVVGRVVLVP